MAGTVLFFALFFYARYDAVNDVSRPNDFHDELASLICCRSTETKRV